MKNIWIKVELGSGNFTTLMPEIQELSIQLDCAIEFEYSGITLFMHPDTNINELWLSYLEKTQHE